MITILPKCMRFVFFPQFLVYLQYQTCLSTLHEFT
ncbi:hypothetical protein GLYMA_20G062350v4 [Glycine max]|nr:hypothetical protein GLYMA_20G062350v4 [Glycine max]KAH1034822.1 hypothetical protein GYH30_054985 [Glycine max]